MRRHMVTPQLQRNVFLLLLAAITLAFGWVLAPFFGAVFWAVALAIVFHAPYQWLRRRLGGRRNVAASLTLLACLLIVILPLVMIAVGLVDEIAALTQRIRGGEINLRTYFQQIMAAAPRGLLDLLTRFGLTNLDEVMDKISGVLLQGGQLITTRALAIGQNTFQFLVQFVVMLYLLYFLVRDGDILARLVRDSVPMSREQTRHLMSKFATVVRATVKGNIVIAVVQGLLGGTAFAVLGIHGAMLWGVVMAFLSLLPAVGAALIWAPVAIYLLATGSTWQALALVGWGAGVMGLIDNILRPLLVGKDTKLPDYVVLLSTLGGMSLFGINGFVIGPTIAALFMACWALFHDEVGSADEDEDDPAFAPTAPSVLGDEDADEQLRLAFGDEGHLAQQLDADADAHISVPAEADDAAADEALRTAPPEPTPPSSTPR